MNPEEHLLVNKTSCGSSLKHRSDEHRYLTTASYKEYVDDSKTCEHFLKEENSIFPEPCLVDGALYSKSGDIPTANNSSGQITVDAVHPFFTGYRNIRYDKATSTDNQQFYCRQCNFHFELCQEAVNEHFTSRQHVPVDKCLYCHLDVYEYFYNENRYYYHRCSEEQIRLQNIGRDGNSSSDISLVEPHSFVSESAKEK